MSRIEKLIDSGDMKAGAAVMLSNYHYWKQGAHGAATQVYDFRLWEGREVPARGFSPADQRGYNVGEPMLPPSCEPTTAASGIHTVISGKAEFPYLVLEPSSEQPHVGNWDRPPARRSPNSTHSFARVEATSRAAPSHPCRIARNADDGEREPILRSCTS